MSLRLLIAILLTSVASLSLRAQTISGVIALNGGAKVTNNANKLVTVNIKAIGASQMMVSNDGSFVGARWEPYTTKKSNWKLVGDDGIKTVYAKFKDGAGNISEIVEATIELDRHPPQEPSVLIN